MPAGPAKSSTPQGRGPTRLRRQRREPAAGVQVPGHPGEPAGSRFEEALCLWPQHGRLRDDRPGGQGARRDLWPRRSPAAASRLREGFPAPSAERRARSKRRSSSSTAASTTRFARRSRSRSRSSSIKTASPTSGTFLRESTSGRSAKGAGSLWADAKLVCEVQTGRSRHLPSPSEVICQCSTAICCRG